MQVKSATLAFQETPDFGFLGKKSQNNEKFAQKSANCYHCHDSCEDTRHRIEDKIFCCEGCQTVYKILNENELCTYYRLDPAAGNSLQNKRDDRIYQWLDEQDVARELLQFSDGKTARVRFNIPAMHCASCIWLLEYLWKLDSGVTRSTVNFPERSLTIQFLEEKTSLRKLAVLLAQLGYPPEISLADVEKNGKTTKADKSLYYKIGIAGFALGNIMLLSFPEYLGLDNATEARFYKVFGYANLLLALPLLLYAARDYFVSAWFGIKNKHLNIDIPLALGMLVLFGRSAYEILSGTGAGYMDSFAGLIFFLLCGRLFQQKTFHHLSFERDYKSYFPVSATVKTPKGAENRSVSKLEAGDILLLKNEELIPADGILTKGQAQIDYSFVTGESEPVAVAMGEKVFAGGKQRGGSIEMTVTRRVNQSYLTQLWNDDAFKDSHKSHATILADAAARYFTILILAVGGGAFLYWHFWRGDTATAFNALTAVFIVACPCAIAISIPFTMGNVLRILGRNRFYFKNIQVLEALSGITAVVFDKTGTLTKVENQAKNKLQFVPFGEMPHLEDAEKQMIRALVRQSAHPKSRHIYENLHTEGHLPEIEHFTEISGAGISGRVLGKQIEIGKTPNPPSEIKNPNLENPKFNAVFVQIDGVSRGSFHFENTYRFGFERVVHYFQKQAKCYLLSGDNDHEKPRLASVFGESKTLFFNQSPQNKLDFIKNLKKKGEKVLVLGDGLNDAGALQEATVGIVLSENTNNFTPACDAILHADEFHRLPEFFDFSQRGMRLVGWSYALAGIYNLIGISYAVTGTLSPVIAAILMPVSSISIIVFGYWGSAFLMPDRLKKLND